MFRFFICCFCYIRSTSDFKMLIFLTGINPCYKFPCWTHSQDNKCIRMLRMVTRKLWSIEACSIGQWGHINLNRHDICFTQIKKIDFMVVLSFGTNAIWKLIHKFNFLNFPQNIICFYMTSLDSGLLALYLIINLVFEFR